MFVRAMILIMPIIILSQYYNSEIDVVNILRNRMVLDETVPKEKRYTWTSIEDVKFGKELLPSGLIEPVTL